MRKHLTTAAICAALTALSAGPALAGEVTGSGANENQNQGMSWCSFSGLNDDPGASTVPPIGENGPGGKSQSFGAGEPAGPVGPAHPGIPGPSATRTGPRCPAAEPNSLRG